MTACPPRENLERMLRSGLSDVDRAAVETHVQDCANCRQTLRLLAGEGETLVGGHAAPQKPDDLAALPAPLRDHPRYRVTELLGAGGMGAVYKADHRLLERPVVLKTILQEFVSDAEMVERFRREARLAARLAHPNIVTLYEAEQVGPTHVMVMEFVDGVDLDRLVQRRGPLPIADACEVVRQAALGLQHAHEQGLVHRDIKPSNLLLNHHGQVKLLDMGLAVLKSEKAGGSRLTGQAQVLGTLDYMAPEQWEDSHAVDIRADIYSLGCTLHELLTGKPPFPGEQYSTPLKQMWAHSHQVPPPIRDLRPDVPTELADVLDHMLAKKPSDRFATPAEAAAELEPFTHGADLPVLLGRPSTPRTALGAATRLRRKKRPPLWAFIAAGAAVLALAAGLIFWLGHRPGAGGTGPEAVVFTGPPLKVGVLHSLSGTMASSERPVVDATLLAIEEVNRAGGVLGRKVEYVAEDGRSNDTVFARKAEKLIEEDGVATIFGCWTSSSRKAVKAVVEKHDHLLIYPVQSEGMEQSPQIIYTGAAPNQQILPALEWCCSDLGKKRLFLVGSDYVFPRAASAIIRDELKTLGAEIVGEEYLPLGDTEVEPVIKKIAAAKPDLIVNLINGDANVAFFRELRHARAQPSELPTISFSIDENLLSTVNDRDIAGDYAAWNYFQCIDRPQNHSFVQRFRERYGPGLATTDPMEAAYFGVHLWAQAVRQAGSDDVKAIRQAMAGQTFDAPGGNVRIDAATGHTWKTVRIGRILDDGSFKIVFSSERPIQPLPYPKTRTRAQWDAFLNDLYQKWGGSWANPGK
jgi:urea transport system substrate-binding protein